MRARCRRAPGRPGTDRDGGWLSNRSWSELLIARMVLSRHNRRTMKSTGPSTAFLIAQVGAHAAAKFAERLAVLELGPAQAGTLRIIRMRSGISQQALSSVLGILPSRLVVLIDELERRGLVERRTRSADRRVYALHLTRKGEDILDAIGKIARAHDD